MICDKSTWEELEKNARNHPENPNAEYYKELTRVSSCYVYSTLIPHEHKWGLFIRYPENTVNRLPPPTAKGFEIHLSKSPNAPSFMELTIVISQADFNDIFVTFCQDLIRIINQIADPKELLDATIEHLNKWQEFMAKMKPDALEPAAQRGLFGELHFLQEYLIPQIGVTEAVRAWYGPEKNPQDFHLPSGIAIEIKTSKAETPVIHINNKHQLDETGLKALYLLLTEVNETGGSSLTLNNVVDRIRDLCSENPEAALEFSSRLIMEMGYLDKDREIYSKTGYAILRERIYHVKGNFPRLIKGNLPETIGGVKYTLDPEVLSSYQVENEKFKTLLGDEN